MTSASKKGYSRDHYSQTAVEHSIQLLQMRAENKRRYVDDASNILPVHGLRAFDGDILLRTTGIEKKIETTAAG